jgi:hypothetical protein
MSIIKLCAHQLSNATHEQMYCVHGVFVWTNSLMEPTKITLLFLSFMIGICWLLFRKKKDV